jgi:5'-nucleotidase
MQTLESLPVIVTRRLLVTSMLAVLVVAGCSTDSNRPADSASSSSAVAAEPPFRILVSNDDGVAAPGIDALVRALTAEAGTEVTVVAPAANQSGTGGRTSPGPVNATKTTTAGGYPATAVEGFPADAVLYGLSSVVTSKQDLVISGVNAGQNVGPFIDISGTVGAARAAGQQGVQALAVSAGTGDPIDFAPAVEAAIDWLREYRTAPTGGRPLAVFNLNVPTCASGTVRGQVNVQPDPTAPADVALAPADCTSTAPAPTTDVAAFHDGYATLSPIGIQPGS